jgi:3-hydroxyacyl-[acyl-carrier-protein] dehydratase
VSAPLRGRAAPLQAIDSARRGSATEIHAEKAVAASDPYLAGHYPDFTIYPGVFTLESVIQAVRAQRYGTEQHPRQAELGRVRSMRLTAPLRPGDVLSIDCRLSELPGGEALRVDGHCRQQDGITVARFALEFDLQGVPGA